MSGRFARRFWICRQHGSQHRINPEVISTSHERRVRLARPLISCRLLSMAIAEIDVPRTNSVVDSRTISYRAWCVLLFGAGFALRLAFMLWHKT